MTQEIETHPFAPWLPENARLLMCGTFPPAPQRWSMEFYYPNYINDMWRVFGIIVHGDKEYFVDAEHRTFRVEEIKQMLSELGIALCDTGREVRRLKGNASDKYLEILRPLDIAATMSRLPECVAIATTGEKAAAVVAEATGTKIPRTGEKTTVRVPGVAWPVNHYRMPSTSRAYPLSVDRKAEYYRTMLKEIGIIK